MAQRPQISATIDPELYSQIAEFAEKENRSMSEAVAILLQRGINEKKRNRRGSKKDNSQHNTADVR